MIEIRNEISKLVILAAMSLFLGLIIFMLGAAIISSIYGLPLLDTITASTTLNTEQEVEIAKFLLFFNSFGLFLVPALLFAFLFNSKPITYLKLHFPKNSQAFFMLVFLFIAFLPIINLTAEWNKSMHLPDFLSGLEQWMRSSEDSAMVLTNRFLEMNGRKDLIINILLIGVVPAIGEELLFRGVVQQSLIKQTRNAHVGIWLSAIIFSAIHFQFYGFIPRMLIGAYMGYLFYWTSNLWIPIAAHFLNNSAAVIGAYYLGVSGMEEKLDKVGTTSDTYLVTLVSAFFFVGLLYLFKRNHTANTT